MKFLDLEPLLVFELEDEPLMSLSLLFSTRYRRKQKGKMIFIQMSLLYLTIMSSHSIANMFTFCVS
jgi:hypothetical protein